MAYVQVVAELNPRDLIDYMHEDQIIEFITSLNKALGSEEFTRKTIRALLDSVSHFAFSAGKEDQIRAMIDALQIVFDQPPISS